MRPHRLQLRRCPRGSRQSSDCLLVLFEGIDLGACGEREGEGADAGEQIGDPLRAADALFDQPYQDCFRLARGLEEGARRQAHLNAGQRHRWRAAKRQALPVERDAGSPETWPCRGQSGEQRRRGANALNHHIEALLGLGDGDTGFALATEQRRERGLELGQAPGDAGAEHRAGGDVDDGVRARGAIAEGDAFDGAAKSKGRPPPAGERHGADLLDRRLKPARGERRDDKLALPGEIGVSLHMLERAAAAGAEILADRSDALRARLENGERLGVAVSGLGVHLHQLAWKREGHEERPVRPLRHAVALGAKPLDPDLKLHGWRRSALPRCRCRPQLGRASRQRPSSQG